MSLIPAIAFPFSAPVVERLGWTLVHSLWQFALVALLVSTILFAMRRSSATLRYGVLVAAMIVSTLAPVATWLLLPIPGFEQTSAQTLSHGERFDPATRLPPDDMPDVGERSFLKEPALGQRPENAAPSATSAHSPPVQMSPETRKLRPLSPLQRLRSALRPWLGWMVAGWCLGVIVCSLRPMLAWHTLRRLRRLATSPASDEVLAAAQRMSRRLGLRRAVKVLCSTLAQVPAVVGYVRPVILLPVSLATNIPVRQLEAILAHELAHVRRHDFAVNLLQTLVETLFFYHPGIWWLSRRIRIEREHCCDDLAVKVLGNRVEYGRALLAIEDLRGPSSVLALGAGGGSLLTRIRRIATGAADRKAASLTDRCSAALLGLAVIGVACFMTVHRTVAKEDSTGDGHAGKTATVAGGDKAAPAAEEYQSATYLQKKLATKIPDAAWGKARDGLRLAIVARDPNNTEWNELPAGTTVPSEIKIHQGDEVRCQLVVENVSDRDIRFSAYTYSDVGRTVEVLDRTGGKADIQSIDLGLPVLPGQWRLQPGERFLLDMPPIHFVDKHPDRGVGYFATTGAGDYSLRCGYTFGDLGADAIQPIARKNEWTGMLTTGALKVTVSDPPAPEKRAEASGAGTASKSPEGAKSAEVAANGEIVGRLMDSVTGKPVEGATIACGALINDSGKGGGANAITDAEGRYRLPVPSPGIYNVWLKKFDQDHSKTAAADDGIRVEAGKVATSQLQLIVGRKVAGKVVDSTGTKYANMEVYCYSAAQPQSGGPQSVTTEADGGFEFAVPPGRAHVYVIEQDQEHPEIPFGVRRSAEANVRVPADGDAPPLTLTLEKSRSRFGDPKWLKVSTPGTQIVRREGNKDVTGTVVGEDGKPIAGARVFPEDGTPVVTDDKGAFRVETMKGTQFIMHAVAPGYHAWFGTPTSGDVLKIVLEAKPPQGPERGALPPPQNPASRTFGLRFKLASDTSDDLRQILLGRPGFEAKPSANNQEIIVTAPPQVLNRIQTFIAVTDWPDKITRGSNFEYPRDSVTRAARSFFYACAIEDSDEAFSKLLSPAVLAELKGDTKSKQYEGYITGGVPDPEWEKQLRGDWPGKKELIQRMVREWNRYPLKRLTEGGGVAIGFGAKYFCSVSFDGAPKDFYEVAIEPDRNAHGAGNGSFLFSALPPWREADPKAAAADEKSFQTSAKIDVERHNIEFVRPPTVGALRQLERLEGDWTVTVRWPGAMDKSAAAAFEGIHVKDVRGVELADPGSIDAWLKDLTRPDTGLKDLTTLDLYQTQVTDAGLKELARPDSGLKALASLSLRGTQVTDAGLKELTRPKSGLKSLASLSLRGTQITGAGLRELSRPDSGLIGLTSLDLGETKVTDADLKELARPDGGLKALASLDLYRTKVTDAGLKELARHDSGLKSLTTLHLNGTQITDTGLKELARPDSGLKALAALDLIRTKVTDVGLKELARPYGGLPALAVLDLYGTQVTDAGIKELARADSGVKRLKLLRLGSTRVTDAAAKELARPDSGLNALASLDLSDTRVTDAGLKELARPDSSVKGLTELSLWATQVTDASLSELSRPDSGLKALTSLYLQRTKVTETGVKELQQARPGLRIEH